MTTTCFETETAYLEMNHVESVGRYEGTVALILQNTTDPDDERSVSVLFDEEQFLDICAVFDKVRRWVRKDRKRREPT